MSAPKVPDRLAEAWVGLFRSRPRPQVESSAFSPAQGPPRPLLRKLAAALLAAALLAGLALGLSPRPDLLEGVSFSRAVLDRSGALLRLSLSRDEKYRLRAGLPDFSPLAVQAALLYEDRHFHRHPGVNPAALVRAAWRTYVSGGRRMGGSTLTMQVARLRFGLNTASPWGKLVQIARALQIERHYSKDQILEAYLNLAPYGSNVEGLAAASWVYFRKPARELTLPEALLLAAVPQNPAARNPLALTGAALTRARERLARMWAEADPARGGQGRGRDRNATPDAARGLPWDTTQGLIQALATAPLAVHGPATLPFLAPHACAELLARPATPRPTRTDEARGKATGNPDQATADPSGPATIRSTIDLPLQRLTERILSRFIQRAKSQGLDNAAALLLDHRTMDILALAGSADFSDPAIAGQVDATRARRSPGSTLKPFIYALALDQGLIHPLTLLADAPRSFHGYTPENADQHFQGPLPARQALALSRNIPAIALANRLARPTFYDFLRRAGVEFASGPEHYGLALVLGGAEVTMRELAGLYAMLPAGGIWRGSRLALDAPRDYNATRSLLTPEAAFVTLDMLRDNPLVPRTLFGEDRGARTAVHSKTGTSNGLRDAWTAGVFGRFVLVVWVGHADGHSDPLLVGARVAAPLFMDLAEALAAREPAAPGSSGPDRPPGGLNLVRAKVCADTGDTDTSLCPRTESTWFIPGVSPIRSTGVYREILVDRATGLRDCAFEEGRTERRVFEFWPSDLARIFAQAGVYKPRPPEFRPECRERAASQGRAPDITVPRAGMRYTVSLSRETDNEVPLSAVVDADAGAVHWFADSHYLGRAEPGQTLAWRPAPGRVTVRAVDDLGRAGSRVVDVELVD